MFEMAKELLRQLFRKPFTNQFPVKRTPNSMKGLFEKAGQGKATLNEPVPVPEGFRGRIEYNREKCIGCRLCIRVCPANCFDYLESERKVHYHLSRCTFCAQCVDVCPVKALSSTKDFLLADYKKQ
jgi:formate hydrogenlyase subunit 6/NADH:ubiquinone oxidoreductase subunit I